MRILETKVYSFDELSEEAKEKAIEKWYENEDYPWMEEDLTESCKALLEENGCTFEDINLSYSLSYGQGDGLCFTGYISKNGNTLRLTHNYRYYFASSVEMNYTDSEGEDIEEVKELKDIYFNICKELEKEGYGILEYRMDFSEFSEHCEANNYEFTEDGKMI